MVVDYLLLFPLFRDSDIRALVFAVAFGFGFCAQK
jgi:hypothetical protein